MNYDIDKKDNKLGYVYILPTIFFLVALRVYPLLRGFYVSLYDTNLINRWDFVGLNNYVDVLFDKDFYTSMYITLIFTLFVVGGHFLIGLTLSHILNKDIKGLTFFRAILILPWIMPESIIAMIFKWLFNPLYGLINNTLLSLSLIDEPLSWLGNGTYAFIAVIAVCIWKGFPMIMVILLAGLQSIDNDMYEAANIDGANGWEQFIYITLPGLKGVLQTALVLDIIWWIKHYTIVWVMTQGGPGTATSLISIDIYKRSFEYFEFGPGSAVAVAVFVLIYVIKTLLERIFSLNEDKI